MPGWQHVLGISSSLYGADSAVQFIANPAEITFSIGKKTMMNQLGMQELLIFEYQCFS